MFRGIEVSERIRGLACHFEHVRSTRECEHHVPSVRDGPIGRFAHGVGQRFEEFDGLMGGQPCRLMFLLHQLDFRQVDQCRAWLDDSWDQAAW